MTTPRKPKSLAAKLAAACDKIHPVPKNGENSKYRGGYVRAADVYAAFRHELLSRGVMIIPNELELHQERIQTNGGVAVLTEAKLKVEYVIVDGISPEMRFAAFGVARDDEDKALYKAKTGAEKYFLIGLGLLPTEDSDNPEFEEHTEDAPAPVAGETKKAKGVRKKDQHAVRDFEVTGFADACEKAGKSLEEVCAYLANEWGVSTIAQLQRKNFKAALQWAMHKNANGSGHPVEVAPTSQPDGDAEPLAETPDRKPQLVVRVLDAEPEFRLRGY